jgi:hypothetical protein
VIPKKSPGPQTPSLAINGAADEDRALAAGNPAIRETAGKAGTWGRSGAWLHESHFSRYAWKYSDSIAATSMAFSDAPVDPEGSGAH